MLYNNGSRLGTPLLPITPRYHLTHNTAQNTILALGSALGMPSKVQHLKYYQMLKTFYQTMAPLLNSCTSAALAEKTCIGQ